LFEEEQEASFKETGRKGFDKFLDSLGLLFNLLFTSFLSLNKE